MSETVTLGEADGQGQEQTQETEINVSAPKPAVPEILPRWAEERLASMRRKLGDEERARALAEARAQELEAKVAAKPEGTPTPQTQGYTEAQLNARALELSARMRFDEACNNIARQGAAKFEDFGAVVGNFGKYLGDIPPAFVEAALETDDAAATIYALGNDMAEATRIAALSPARQAAAIVKFASKLGKEESKPNPAPSAQTPAARAPAPIVPRVGSASGPRNTPVRLDDDNTDIGDWMKARRESLKRA